MKVGKDGLTRYHTNDTIGRAFAQLLKDVQIGVTEGTGFYSLRRTAATLAAIFKDPFAIQKLLGHADLKMATTYIQNNSEQTDNVISQTRTIIIQDTS
jgi:integrase